MNGIFFLHLNHTHVEMFCVIVCVKISIQYKLNDLSENKLVDLTSVSNVKFLIKKCPPIEVHSL